MQRSGRRTRVARLRHSGIRVSSGPWVMCAARAEATRGCLIVALGRTAGCAVTRSRIRRLAREVSTTNNLSYQGQPLDLLLFVRRGVDEHPRRRVREDLERLLARVPEALRRRDARGTPNGLVERSGPPSA